MSSTAVFHPIVAALRKAQEILGSGRIWKGFTPELSQFIHQWLNNEETLENFSETELRSWASYVASELNEILAKEGFNISLDEFKDGEFGVVSILDVLVEWIIIGSKSFIRRNETTYDAVEIPFINPLGNTKEDMFSFQVFESERSGHPIVGLKTKTTDRVFMTIADKAYESFDLILRVNSIRSSLIEIDPFSIADQIFPNNVRFPMVDLDQEVDIGWLLGLTTTDLQGRPFCVSQAKQQTKFKMNEIGARVKSVVAIGLGSTSIQVPIEIVIDKPFFLWIEREGLVNPIMYAYLDEENWKNPKNLDL